MLSIYDKATAEAVLSQPIEPALKRLIQTRLDTADRLGLNTQTHLVVIEQHDTEAAILRELGWSPLVHPIDGTRYGQADFEPYWAWLQDVSGWYLLLHTVGNAGFAYILLIAKGEGIFARMCREALDGGNEPCGF